MATQSVDTLIVPTPKGVKLKLELYIYPSGNGYFFGKDYEQPVSDMAELIAHFALMARRAQHKAQYLARNRAKSEAKGEPKKAYLVVAHESQEPGERWVLVKSSKEYDKSNRLVDEVFSSKAAGAAYAKAHGIEILGSPVSRF